jgi:hypothetical protein
MNRRNIFSLSAISALGLAMLPGSADAQQKTLKEQIVGTWSVSLGSKRAPMATKTKRLVPVRMA